MLSVGGIPPRQEYLCFSNQISRLPPLNFHCVHLPEDSDGQERYSYRSFFGFRRVLFNPTRVFVRFPRDTQLCRARWGLLPRRQGTRIWAFHLSHAFQRSMAIFNRVSYHWLIGCFNADFCKRISQNLAILIFAIRIFSICLSDDGGT